MGLFTAAQSGEADSGMKETWIVKRERNVRATAVSAERHWWISRLLTISRIWRSEATHGCTCEEQDVANAAADILDAIIAERER
jgi:hypothetical protein